MSAPIVGLIAPSKRLSLEERLNHIADMEDGEFFELLEELENDEQAAVGFRWHAPRTQGRQDTHLRMYHRFVTDVLFRRESLSETELDLKSFPADFKKLYKQVRLFVIFVYKNARPTALAAGERIQYNSLAGYRKSLMFWVARRYDERDQEPPPSRKLFKEMTEAMRAAQAKYHGNSALSAKTYLGLEELRQLIDHEMTTTRCIELSEQHQLAWCIGRTVALRPGSLGSSYRGRSQPLQWKDIEIVRGEQVGMFEVKYTWRNVKISNDPEKGVQRQQIRNQQAIILSPRAENIVFSVPHRLLSIAIRRKLLVGIESLDELMASDKRYVMIKPEHLNDPVLYKGTPRGLAIAPPDPLHARSISSYLCERGYALGYQCRISFYSLRRRTATDLVRRVGLEVTRDIMGHDPETRTLERYYLNQLPTFDVTATTMNEPIEPGGQSSSMLRANATLALGRLDEEHLRRTRGAALNSLTIKLINSDEKLPANASPAELKQYKKRVRRRALRALISQQGELHKASMTQQQYQERLVAASASDFAAAVIKRAQESMLDGPDQVTFNEEMNENLDEDFPETEDDAEPDIEEEAEHFEGAVPRLQLDDNVNEQSDEVEGAAANMPYVFHAKALMQLLLENTLTTYKTWAEGDTTCPLCAMDDTVDDEQKAKQWSNEAKLNIHMDTKVHSPVARWKRRQVLISKSHPQKRLVCPYCQAAKKEEYTYAGMKELLRHVVDSTEKYWGTEHDGLKREDGFYDDDFMGHLSEKAAKDRAVLGKRTLEAAGIHFSEHPELPGPVPHPTLPGVVLGDFQPRGVPPRFQGLMTVTDGPSSSPEGVPAHLKDFIVVTKGPTYGGGVPEHLKDEIIITKGPPPFKRAEK